MNPNETKALLRDVKQSLDGLLLRDRAELNALMRAVRRRIHDGQPADRLIGKLQRCHARALKCAEARADIRLQIAYPPMLPVSAQREAICRLIASHQVVIVCGTTGSGKTTQLPKMAMEAGCGRSGRIGITQPRRLAATGMARRVAEETATDYGREVGCQVRFDDRTGDETVIKFMTDGILLAETQHDRHLLQYDALIIDEAHERSLNIDFILGYLKNLLPVRPDLKVIISSATLDAESFSAFFNNAPVIEVEGRTYPVDDFFLPPRKDEELSAQVARAVRWISDIDDRGDVLVFLPGEREIREAAKKLEGRHLKDTEILPLFGRLSLSEQQRVFQTGGRRRIILATNVAETSITIPGIHYVIDSGLVRLSRYNPRTQIQRLQIEQISQASARQRRGRCGRVTDGICIYLYEREVLENSARFTDPEIRRTSLAGVILQMSLLELPPIEQFPLIDPPPGALINEGYRTLFDIGAIDSARRLTDLGRKLARFPVDPHLARMLLQAYDEGALPELLVISAFLAIQDVRERPADQAEAADRAHAQWQDPKSDFVTILNLWYAVEKARRVSQGRLRTFCRTHFINYRRVVEWRNLWQDLRQSITEEGTSGRQTMLQADDEPVREVNYPLIHRGLLAGLPANIGLRGAEREFQGARNRRFFIFPGSGLFKKPPEWVMAFALVETTKCYARMTAEIDPQWVVDVAPHLCKAVYTQAAWNPDKGFVYARESILSGGLTLTEGKPVHYGPIHPEEARRIFIRDALVPANLTTRGGWLKLHRRMLDDIEALEEKIRRPGTLLDTDAVYDHFDHLLPPDVCSVKSLEQWLRKSRARMVMKMDEALYPQVPPIRAEDYPDTLTFNDIGFHVIYTFDPGAELDGMALVCPTDQLARLPDAAPDWLVPGWLTEKVRRLLGSLPKNLRAAIAPVDETAKRFRHTCAGVPQDHPLLDVLSAWLQREYRLPVDASDFDSASLPGFLRMKVIETRGDEIVQVHTALSEAHRQRMQRDGLEAAFAKWTLPPCAGWPGEALPEFVTAGDSRKTRGYPALTAEAGGVGRRIFIDPLAAAYSHRAGLVRLFRIREGDQVAYVEKRPPLSPSLQLSLSLLDSDFLQDFIDAAIHTALTGPAAMEIRDPDRFAARAAEARGLLYATAADQAQCLTVLLEQREAIIAALDTVQGDARNDTEMQLAFLFRPGFLRMRGVYARYPRYLKALTLRIQRCRANPQADARKMADIHPFQERLSDALLQRDSIAASHDLLEFAMLLEEFRVNRFAPEIGTPEKVSAQRLEQAWSALPEAKAK